MHPFGLQCRLDCHRFNHSQYLRRDRSVHASSTKAKATRQTEHEVRAVAAIGRSAGRSAGVDNRQSATAAPAGEHAREQGAAAPAGLLSAGATIGIGGEQALVALVVHPVDVAFVVVTDQNIPRFWRLPVPVGLARPAVDHLDPLLAFAVDIGARVKRILQEADHVTVADRSPVERSQPLAVRGPRKEDALRRQRQMRLPRTAKLTEPLEYQPDHPARSRMSGSKPSPMSRCQT